MNDSTKRYLDAWIGVLDKAVGDTEAEIAERRAQNQGAVALRDDLKALVQYMETHDLPEVVYSALNQCLSWNPHARAPAHI